MYRHNAHNMNTITSGKKCEILVQKAPLLGINCNRLVTSKIMCRPKMTRFKRASLKQNSVQVLVKYIAYVHTQKNYDVS